MFCLKVCIRCVPFREEERHPEEWSCHLLCRENWGKENQKFRFVHGKFELPLDTQVDIAHSLSDVTYVQARASEQGLFAYRWY